MPESDIISDNTLPLTVDSLAEQFVACGLVAGQTVLVHSSMSKMGWITGGPVAVIQALLRVLTPSGTLMMPTHTNANTDPTYWQHPPVPESWWPIIQQHSPAFDPAITPTREMGCIPELFRTWPGALRSSHPIGSFAALGPNAAYLTANHSLEDMFGENSPVGKLYALDGYIMLLGVDHGNDTSLHLAEFRANWPGKRKINEGTSMFVNGVRQWVNFEMFDLETNDFNQIGDSYEAQYHIPRHRVGQAEVRFMKQRPFIDYAVQWMEMNRNFINHAES
jgi:aminoglycoside 3-N-acetyltransferase